MKELSFEKMEVLQGGIVCFFAVPWVLLSVAVSTTRGWISFGVAYYECWRA